MIIINHLKSISSEHGKENKNVLCYAYRSGDSFVSTLSSFLSCKRALVFFLLNPNRLVMPSSWSYEEQWQHNKWRQCMNMWHHGSGSCTCNCCCKHANKKPKFQRKGQSKNRPTHTPYTTSTHVYHIQNSVQVTSPSPLIKIEIVTKIYSEDQSNATTWVIMTDQPFFLVLNKFLKNW